MERFIVLKDIDGILRPMAFIVRDNPLGESSANDFSDKQMSVGESLVVVEFKEIEMYDIK